MFIAYYNKYRNNTERRPFYEEFYFKKILLLPKDLKEEDEYVYISSICISKHISLQENIDVV